MDYSFEYKDNHLEAKIQGKWKQNEIIAFLSTCYRELKKSKTKLLLINAQKVSKPPKDLYRFKVGKHIADVFDHTYKIAIVFNKNNITKFAENTAVNRGSEVLVCPNEQDALRWFLQKSSN